MMRPSGIALLAVSALICWTVSLLLPAVDVGPATPRGWQFLIYGWQGIPALSIGGLSWLANPLFILSSLALFLSRSTGPSFVSAALALLAALTSFFFNAARSEDSALMVEHFRIGFYLWMLAIVVQTVAAIAARRRWFAGTAIGSASE